MDWLEVAQQLPLGHKRRFQHECGEDRAGLASHGPEGYSGYCFRCGKLGFKSHGYRSLEELARVRALNAEAAKPQETEIPYEERVSEIPLDGRNWLYAAGIYGRRAAELDVFYSSRLMRVVLPLEEYWQARAVHPGQSPKYVNPSVDKSGKVFFPRRGCGTNSGRVAGLVVTEDYLSAARVDPHVSACTVLGTKLSDQQAITILEAAGAGTIYIWLDPDPAGEAGAAAMLDKFMFVTDNVRIITSRDDPKRLSDREIRECLTLKPNHRYTYHGP